MMNIEKQANEDHAALTSGEIAYLWSTYEYETLSKCGLTFFLQHIDDLESEELLKFSLGHSDKRINKVIEILTKEGHPIPKGFTEGDINEKAPRLFSDVLYLEYILYMAKLKLFSYNMAFMEAVKLDIMEFYSEAVRDSLDLEVQAIELAKKKGVYIRAPRLPVQTHVEVVKKENFLKGWFGSKRPLLAIEIAQLVFHARRNALGQAVITGFSQVAKSKEVRRYFEKGREIAGKHLQVLTEKLHDEYLQNAAILLTSEVTKSKEAPFSDKLMMTFITTLIGSSIGGYGSAMSLSPRRDLGVMYTRLIAELMPYAEEGIEILINNGWMEQPPMAADRKDLAK